MFISDCENIDIYGVFKNIFHANVTIFHLLVKQKYNDNNIFHLQSQYQIKIVFIYNVDFGHHIILFSDFWPIKEK